MTWDDVFEAFIIKGIKTCENCGQSTEPDDIRYAKNNIILCHSCWLNDKTLIWKIRD